MCIVFCIIHGVCCPFVSLQSDNDLSLSGIPLTALHFSNDTHILVTGDQSGTVSKFSCYVFVRTSVNS